MSEQRSADQTTQYLAVRWREDYGVLGAEPAALFEHARSIVSARWPHADEFEREMLWKVGGCLDRLTSFLLQVARMASHAGKLAEDPWPAQAGVRARLLPGMTAAQTNDEACADFESLLFHGRAALDRLTLFVSGRHRQPTDRFSKLTNTLGNFAHKDERAAQVLQLLAEAPGLTGVLKNLDSGARALRSSVAHQVSLQEAIESAFTVIGLADGRVLIFDCKALGYPVLGTSHSLAAEVPFVVLNAVAIYLGKPAPLARAVFEPPWQNPAVLFDDFIDPTNAGPIFGVVKRMTPDGFELRQEHLRGAVIDRAVTLPQIATQEPVSDSPKA